MKINLVYFSATGTTAKIVSEVANGLGSDSINVVNILKQGSTQLNIPNDELVVFGVPVFSGRVPEIARKAIENINGLNTPAVVVCVYGNRHYDDALIELKEIVTEKGFNVLSAAAFVAQHSIFPSVAPGRPNEVDLNQAKDFGKKIREFIGQSVTLTVPGSHPYRAIKPIPLIPKTDGSCNQCRLCAKQCPMQAIDKENNKKIDKTKCIRCAHCISICPNSSKRFGGLLYWIASKKFTKDYSKRKENLLLYPDNA